MSTLRRTTVSAPTSALRTLEVEADRRGLPLAAILREAVVEKAASIRSRRRPQVGVARSTDGRAAAVLTAEPVAEPLAGSPAERQARTLAETTGRSGRRPSPTRRDRPAAGDR